jgi:hypothetical protein
MSGILQSQRGEAAEAAKREINRHSEMSWSWSTLGWLAGFLGAFVVAAFFLVIDMAAGRPLWTPAVLGSALFLGVPLAREADSIMVLAAGYTAVHLGIFAGIGLVTATILSWRPVSRPLWEWIAIGMGLFALFEMSFAAFDWLFAPNLMSDLGAVRVAAANALAAAAMTGFLASVALRLRPDEG